YALGAILYEMLTGRPPFRAATPVETIFQVVTVDPVPPSYLLGSAAVPRHLETICLKCLNKEAARRYASAQELAEDLKRFLAGEMIHARRPHLLARGLHWARRRPALAGLVLALVLAVAGGLAGMTTLWLRAEAQRELAQKAKEDADRARAALEEHHAQMEAARGIQFLDEGDHFAALAWFVRPIQVPLNPKIEDRGSRIGKRVDPRSSILDLRFHRLRVAAVLRQSPRLVQLWSHPRAVNAVAFSPDGRLALAAGDDGAARVRDVITGKPIFEPLRHDGPIVPAAFRAAGAAVVTRSQDQNART